MSAQFENASVTPSQSASQVQYGNRLNSQGPSQRYSTNLHDIGDASGPDAPEKNGNQQQDDTDTESEDDYQRAFGGDNLNRHSNVPPPHLLSQGAGTDADLFPSAPRHLAPPTNGKKNGNRTGNSPAPTPPRKDSSSDLRKERAAAVAAHPQVPMPSIPSAPRFNMDGTNLGSVPRAPSMFVAGGDAESSSDEEARPTTQNRGWGSRITPSRSIDNRSGVGAGARRRGGDNSSDEGTAITGKKKGFFGKVGKLFKTDLQRQPSSAQDSSRHQTPDRQRSTWDTRTDANLGSSRAQDSSISRRTSVMRGSINPPADDSSDEEDNREVVRNVNPRRPLWQGEKASSDVGVGGGVGSLSKRPSMLKRSSSNATARITPGPMSSKAAEEAARRSVIGAGFAGTPSKETRTDGDRSIKKKKKKKKTEAGSEVGTSATRTRASGPPPASSSGAKDRNFVVIPGDASSGIRRSGSLSTATGKGAAGSLSRTGTSQSIRSVDGGKKKRSSIANMSPNDGDGKFTTSSWIAKSESNPAVQNMTAAQAAANAGVVSKGSAAAVPTSHTIATVGSSPARTKSPAPTQGSSATRGAPLKPALKQGSLSRSGSYGSSAGLSPAAMLGAPITAPPPMSASNIFTPTAPPPMSSAALAAPVASSSQGPPRLPALSGLDQEDKATPKAPESALSLREDKTFDGTGHLDISMNSSESTPQKSTQTPKKKQSIPKLDMPASEPFSIDLEARRGSNATAHSPGLMTPSQKEAYDRILGEGSADEVKPIASRHLSTQPEGVTRITDRSQKLSTSRTYSSGGGVDDSSSESEAGLEAPASHAKDGSSDAARKAAEHQMLGAFADQNSDPQLKGLSASVGTGSQPTKGLAPTLVGATTRSDTSSSAVGAGVERRKSVRMAPDTKLSPETPTGESFNTTPRGTHSETRDPLAAAGASQLSSRIAPPPQAPPRLPNKETQDQPIDIGRERSSWSTRIGQAQDDSSSDEDDNAGGLNSYASARRAFGSASRHLGKATGEVKPKKSSAAAQEEEVSSIKKTKKSTKKKPANHGYNASVPLPAGMEVVGRSPSVRKK